MTDSGTVKPLIGLPTDTYTRRGLRYNSAVDLYARAVSEVSDAIPVFLPAIFDAAQIGPMLSRLDGVLITGAGSNVHPHRYGRPATSRTQPYDPRRDSLSLGIIEAALAKELPLLAICRGMQELNVVLGGTLRNDIHTKPGHLDHLGSGETDADKRYAPRHPVVLAENGQLARLFGTGQIIVNSVHRQAVDELAPGLFEEASATDGIIEAVSVSGARTFAVGVQWHPEYHYDRDPNARALFKAFGTAVGQRPLD